MNHTISYLIKLLAEGVARRVAEGHDTPISDYIVLQMHHALKRIALSAYEEMLSDLEHAQYVIEHSGEHAGAVAIGAISNLHATVNERVVELKHGEQVQE